MPANPRATPGAAPESPAHRHHSSRLHQSGCRPELSAPARDQCGLLMCEQLGHVLVPAATAACFLVGLRSVLDVLRDHPLADILQGLLLTEQPRMALLAHTGVCGTIMHSVLAYEHGHWEEVRLQSKYGPVGRPVPA